jgi:hypothetical protein
VRRTPERRAEPSPHAALRRPRIPAAQLPNDQSAARPSHACGLMDRGCPVGHQAQHGHNHESRSAPSRRPCGTLGDQHALGPHPMPCHQAEAPLTNCQSWHVLFTRHERSTERWRVCQPFIDHSSGGPLDIRQRPRLTPVDLSDVADRFFPAIASAPPAGERDQTVRTTGRSKGGAAVSR